MIGRGERRAGEADPGAGLEASADVVGGTRVGRLRICPHCWGVNRTAERLCGRCGADMLLLLQESGGLRRTAAVQSPVPIRPRLTLVQRVVVLGFVVMLALAYVLGALQGLGRSAVVPMAAEPAGSQP